MCSGAGICPSATTTCTCWTLVSTAKTVNQSKTHVWQIWVFFYSVFVVGVWDFQRSASIFNVKMCVFLRTDGVFCGENQRESPRSSKVNH